jgi:predicted AlkP superfamily phosphohydrolase/phosphomutase
MFVESTPDRVQHMMYQFSDATHPAYDAAKAARTTTFFDETLPLSQAIRASYQSMDRLVGEVVDEHLRPGDTLLICSDHGFQSFRRQVHLNNWLAREGFLSVRPGVSKQDMMLGFVDWSRTRAYALGLGGIYLNLAGRERDGIVAPADAPALLQEIKARLLALTDDQGGARVVRDAYVLSEIHAGPHLDQEADLMVGFEAGWRVSWSTTLGDMALVESDGGYAPGPVFEDNRLNWSGDHVSVAADLVEGVFFSNRKVDVPAGGIDLLHVAPTALAILGVPVPAAYDHPALTFRD